MREQIQLTITARLLHILLTSTAPQLNVYAMFTFLPHIRVNFNVHREQNIDILK